MDGILERKQGYVRAFIEDHRLNYPDTSYWMEAQTRNKYRLSAMVDKAILEAIKDGRSYLVQRGTVVHQHTRLKPPHNEEFMLEAWVYIANEEDAEIGDYLHPNYFGDLPDKTYMSLPDGKMFQYSPDGWERIH